MNDETSLISDGQDSTEEQANTHQLPNDDHTYELRKNTLPSNPDSFERPDDLDPTLWDEENNTFKPLELYKSWKAEKDKALNLRKTISKGLPKAAEKIEDYVIENAQDLGIDPEKDRLDVLKNIALKSELSNAQFQKMLKAFHEADKEGHLNFEDEVDTEKAAELEQERVQKEIELLGKDGPKVVSNVKAWGRQLLNDGVLSKEDFEAYRQLGTSANQIRVLDKLRQASGYITDIQVNAQPINGAKSREEIESMMADPRYETDAAYRRPIDEWFANNS